MKSDRPDKADIQERDLLVILAKINDHMMEIRNNLASNPAVIAATRGCDIRRYRDFMEQDEVHCFEAYVEAETHMGEIICWSLDITLRSRIWKFQRYVAKQTSDGAQYDNEFEDFAFEDFDGLANNCVTLMTEFSQSAKNFDFRLS